MTAYIVSGPVAALEPHCSPEQQNVAGLGKLTPQEHDSQQNEVIFAADATGGPPGGHASQWGGSSSCQSQAHCAQVKQPFLQE